jgi:hypothetical protein
MSACPLQLDMRGWLSAADADPDAPDARARWASGQSQVLGWFAQEDPTAETLISMHTEEGTFVKTADDGSQTLEIGLSLREPNVERLRYYDLPTVWKSTGYWARLSAGSPDQDPSKQGPWAEMWETGTADGTPMMFCLDDLVLTDARFEPIEWKADGTPENRIALFCNTFDKNGTGPGGVKCNFWGIFDPDDAQSYLSKDPTDITDRNYIATYPTWTRLVADGEGRPVGARAAVRYVDSPPLASVGTKTMMPDAKPMIRSDFFVHQPMFNQFMPFTRNTQRNSSTQSKQTCEEWRTPFNRTDNWDIWVGRFDMALLRCCDVVEDKEIAVNLVYLRMHYDFSKKTKAAGWNDVNLAPDKQGPFASDACENACKRWNGEDSAAKPARFEAESESVPLKVLPRWYMQNVPEGMEHFRVTVFDPSGDQRAWMSLLEGTGAITLDGADAAASGAYVMAHEIGHAGALFDEYNEKWTEYSNNRRSYMSWIPGDPWESDPDSIMNEGLLGPRPRHYWHAAEWCRFAMDDVGLVVKQENTGPAGPAEFEFKLPPHPRAPYRSYVNWPLFSVVNAVTDDRSRFHAYLYPAGKEGFAYEAASNSGDPFDGFLVVRVNMRLNFTQAVMPIPINTVADLIQGFHTSVQKTFNNTFIATGFKLGEVEFNRCLVTFAPCYAVENIPDDGDPYLCGHKNVVIPADAAQRAHYISNTLPSQWKQALDGREQHHPTDVFVNATDALEAGESAWSATQTLGRPTLDLSLNDPSADFFKFFGQMLGLGETPDDAQVAADKAAKKWWQKLIPSRDGPTMCDKLTEVVLRSITEDGSITKL